MTSIPKERLFEFFDAEKSDLKVKNDVNGNATECEPECETILDDFAESDKDKIGIWYRGENRKIADVAATLRKFAAEKGYHITASVAETSDKKEAILLSRLSETEFKAEQKRKQ